MSHSPVCSRVSSKRSIDGAHHHVSAEHLPRYLAEFDSTTQPASFSARLERMIDQKAGRRLTYKPLNEG